jgi:hypothetical protein
VAENLFQDLHTLSVLAGGEDSHLGFVFSKCSQCLRAYLSELQPRTPPLAYATAVRQLVGAYVVSIQGRSVCFHYRASQYAHDGALSSIRRIDFHYDVRSIWLDCSPQHKSKVRLTRHFNVFTFLVNVNTIEAVEGSL